MKQSHISQNLLSCDLKKNEMFAKRVSILNTILVTKLKRNFMMYFNFKND